MQFEVSDEQVRLALERLMRGFERSEMACARAEEAWAARRMEALRSNDIGMAIQWSSMESSSGLGRLEYGKRRRDAEALLRALPRVEVHTLSREDVAYLQLVVGEGGSLRARED